MRLYKRILLFNICIDGIKIYFEYNDSEVHYLLNRNFNRLPISVSLIIVAFRRANRSIYPNIVLSLYARVLETISMEFSRGEVRTIQSMLLVPGERRI